MKGEWISKNICTQSLSAVWSNGMSVAFFYAFFFPLKYSGV
ncbi:hypothetical protein DB29_03662 [Shouchella clausii]|nr:hypothetical protein DB29_03662 [Shouchella clausii]